MRTLGAAALHISIGEHLVNNLNDYEALETFEQVLARIVQRLKEEDAGEPKEQEEKE